MIKNLLPKILRKVSIITKPYKGHICSFDEANDRIVFVKKEILSRNYLKRATEIYFKKELSKREFLLICLLHELGHRYRIINKLADNKLYRLQRNALDYKYRSNEVDNIIIYWNHITEEKEAMNFAKRIFNKIPNKNDNKI